MRPVLLFVALIVISAWRWFTHIAEDGLCGHAALESANVFALRRANVRLIPAWMWPFHADLQN